MIIVDAQLPPALAVWLTHAGMPAKHVGAVMGDPAAADATIWQYASQPGWVIISKDQDFADRGMVHGPPPIVIHIVLGNCSNRRLIEHLQRSWSVITPLLAQPDAAVITVDWHAIGLHTTSGGQP
jgi:predicted nuclease of predicted toxin-antitoxin system